MTHTIKTAKHLCRYFMKADIPVWLIGPPGVGKSDLWRQLAEEASMGFKDERVSQLDPVDLRGLPHILNGTTMWSRPELLPDVDRDGKRGIFLLDELGDSSRAMQSATYQLILNRCVGPHKIDRGWYPCAASNDRSHRAAAQAISTALANRFAWIEITPDQASWDEWAAENGIHELVRAYLKFAPGKLHSMEGADLRAFPTPRSWAMASRIMETPGKDRVALLAALVGPGVAGEFEGFLRTLDLPSFEEIVSSPNKCHIPKEPSSKFALSAMLSRKATRGNLERIVTYCKRPEFGREFEISCMLDATKRDESLCETRAYVDFGQRNSDLHL